MDQNTHSWLEWRKKGICASDAPIVLGVSPWKTPLELYHEKLNPEIVDQGNWATDRGHALEPAARAAYEFETGIEMKPTLFVHDEIDYLRASLDGWNNKQLLVLEIKCPGKEDHETAKQGKVPEKYWPQVQFQMAVSGAKELHYWSYYVADVSQPQDGEGVLIKVKPDTQYILDMLKCVIAFWCENILKRNPPPLSDRDYLELDSEEDKALFSELRLVNSIYKENEAKRKELIEKCKERITHARVRCEGVSVTTTKKGTKTFRFT